MASSLDTILDVGGFFRRIHVLKECQSKMFSDLICFGLLRVATIGIRDFLISTEFAEFFELSVVACLVVRPLVLPIFLDCEHKAGRTSFISVLCDLPLTGTSRVTNATRSIEQLTPLGDGRFL